MKQNTKDWIQYGSAIAMLASAIVLAFVSFFCIQYIHSSVIAYVGEAIAFAAGVFGLALYTHNEIKRQFKRMGRDSAQGVVDIVNDNINEEEEEGENNQ